jgi:hypothetical protein
MPSGTPLQQKGPKAVGVASCTNARYALETPAYKAVPCPDNGASLAMTSTSPLSSSYRFSALLPLLATRAKLSSITCGRRQLSLSEPHVPYMPVRATRALPATSAEYRLVRNVRPTVKSDATWLSFPNQGLQLHQRYSRLAAC